MSLNLVYERQVERGTAVFFDLDPDWNRLLLAPPKQASITVFEGWHGKGLPSERKISLDLPCHYGGEPYLMGWIFVPGAPHAILNYCYSVYLVDLNTLKPIKKILDGQRRIFQGIAVSAHSRYAALYSNRADGKEYKIELLDRETWEVFASWPADVSVLEFTPDGRYLFGTFMRNLSGEAKGIVADTCGVEMFDLPNGKIISYWSLDSRKHSCPTFNTIPLPGAKYAAVSDELLGKSINVWDLQSGELIRKITSSGRISSPIAVSPDGRWLVARVAADPDEAFINQDFKVWDLKTGQVLYESPRYLQLFSPRLTVPPVSFQFSADAKYLLVNKYSKISIYELAAVTE